MSLDQRWMMDGDHKDADEIPLYETTGLPNEAPFRDNMRKEISPRDMRDFAFSVNKAIEAAAAGKGASVIGITGVVDAVGDVLLTVTYSDGSLHTTNPIAIPVVAGPQGPMGTAINVRTAVTDMTALRALTPKLDEAVFVKSDGDIWVHDGIGWVDFGHIEGVEGQPGPIGLDGHASTVPGPQGNSGPQGSPGFALQSVAATKSIGSDSAHENLNFIFTLSDGTVLPVTIADVPTKGEKGDTGNTGTPGTPGITGPVPTLKAAAAALAAGAVPTVTLKGVAGNYELALPQGIQGIQGVQGVLGGVGPAGRGVHIKGSVSELTTAPPTSDSGDLYLYMPLPQGSTASAVAGASWPGVVGDTVKAGYGLLFSGTGWKDIGLLGVTGPQGTQGPQGLRGGKGEKGEIGPSGADSTVQGPAGHDPVITASVDAVGDLHMVIDGGADRALGHVKGADGVAGPVGATPTLLAATGAPLAAGATPTITETPAGSNAYVIALPRGDVGAIGNPGNPGGQGPVGPAGTSIHVTGAVADATSLPGTGNTPGDGHITTDDGHLHIWGSPAIGVGSDTWNDAGKVKGDRGAQGTQGIKGDKPAISFIVNQATGVVTSIIDTVSTSIGTVKGVKGDAGPSPVFDSPIALAAGLPPTVAAVAGSPDHWVLGIPVGTKGDKGDAGTGLSVKGSVANAGALPTGAAAGDTYITTDDGHGHVSDGAGHWTDTGAMKGDKGEKGDIGASSTVQGPVGPAPTLTINPTVAKLGAAAVPTVSISAAGELTFGLPQGVRGADGTSVKLLGAVADKATLDALPTAALNAGDMYVVNAPDGHAWSWDGAKWVDVGGLQGPKGDDGDRGFRGPVGPQPTLTFTTTGSPGDAPTLVAGVIPGEWLLNVPRGAAGPAGAGVPGLQGAKGDTGPGIALQGAIDPYVLASRIAHFGVGDTGKAFISSATHNVDGFAFIKGHLVVWTGTALLDAGMFTGPAGPAPTLTMRGSLLAAGATPTIRHTSGNAYEIAMPAAKAVVRETLVFSAKSGKTGDTSGGLEIGYNGKIVSIAGIGGNSLYLDGRNTRARASFRTGQKFSVHLTRDVTDLVVSVLVEAI